MELECTFVTCPYPEPGKSSPQNHIPFPNDPSYYYNFFYACVSEVFFSLRFPTQTLLRSLLSPYALHSQAISFISILSTDKCWVRITHHNVPHNSASSTPQYIDRLIYNIFSLVPYSKTPFANVPLKCNRSSSTPIFNNRKFYNSFFYL